MGPWIHFRSTLDFDSKCTKHCTVSFFDAHYQIDVDILILKTTVLSHTETKKRKEKKRKEKSDTLLEPFKGRVLRCGQLIRLGPQGADVFLNLDLSSLSFVVLSLLHDKWALAHVKPYQWAKQTFCCFQFQQYIAQYLIFWWKCRYVSKIISCIMPCAS